MSSFPSLPLFTDAYIADTAHLTMEEHGAYLRLLMFAWRTKGCKLANDDVFLARTLGISAAKWLKLKPNVMAFWTLSGGSWTQRRLSKEYGFVAERVKKRRAAGKQGGRPKSLENQETSKAKGSQEKSKPKAPNPNPNPIDSPVVPKGTKENGFADFWRAYPKRRGENSEKAAAKAYAKAVDDGAQPAAIISAATAFAAEMRTENKIGGPYVPMAAKWLHEARFARFSESAAMRGDTSAGLERQMAAMPDERLRHCVQNWRNTSGQWLISNLSEPPDDPRTKVPAYILAEFGIVHPSEQDQPAARRRHLSAVPTSGVAA